MAGAPGFVAHSPHPLENPVRTGMTIAGSRHDADAALLDRMVRAIVDEADPEQVILFGSRARGDATAESDYDLIVVEAGSFDEGRSRLAESARLYRTLAEFDVEVDVLVYCRSDVARWRDSLNHVLARALREGRVLYDRS